MCLIWWFGCSSLRFSIPNDVHMSGVIMRLSDATYRFLFRGLDDKSQIQKLTLQKVCGIDAKLYWICCCSECSLPLPPLFYEELPTFPILWHLELCTVKRDRMLACWFTVLLVHFFALVYLFSYIWFSLQCMLVIRILLFKNAKHITFVRISVKRVMLT